MSESKQLFEPPTSYPEPPKDMWYQVPAEKPKPTATPRMIFPWEERAPKATRVFPRSREPSPPPQEEEEEEETFFDSSTNQTTSTDQTHQEGGRRQSQSTAATGSFTQTSTGQLSSADFAPARPPSPPRHIFPWEARAPKATRVFPQEKGPSPPPNTSRAATDREPPAASEVEDALNKTIAEAARQPDNPWDAFAQQTNKWDEDPEISRFMESFNRPRKAQVHVLHDNRSSADAGQGPPPAKERRTSLKLTDFPTEVERPSLPVTPAPIRRPTLWGSDEPQDQSILPIAKGVPRQDEWVRRFTSQCLPDFPDPVLRDIGGVLHLTCQHCGRQNPIIKLEELQRKQSLILSGEDRLQSKTPPRRQNPESANREEAIEAAMRGINAGTQRPKTPTRPILKEPSFEVFGGDDEELRHDSLISTAHLTATGSKSPTRFNPIVMEGEAASEASSYLFPEDALRGGAIPLNVTSSTAGQHSILPRSSSSNEAGNIQSSSTTRSSHGAQNQSSFTSYSMEQRQSSSFTSQSTQENRSSFNSAVTLPVEEILSPTSTA